MRTIVFRCFFQVIAVTGFLMMTMPSGLAMGPDEKDSDLTEWLGWIKDGRVDEAVAKLEAKAGMLPNDPDVLTVYAFALRKKGEYDRAEIIYGQALDINDGHLGALNYLGHLYVETGRVDEAKAILARIDDACFFGCREEDELEAMIETGSSGKY